MTEFKTFDNIEDMFKEIEESRKEADANVKPWQAELKNGDHFIRVWNSGSEEITIYGVVEDSPYEEDREQFAKPHMKHFRMTRCFSQECPEGELGSTHVSTIHYQVDQEVFDFAKELNWPDYRELADALNALNDTIEAGKA